MSKEETPFEDARFRSSGDCCASLNVLQALEVLVSSYTVKHDGTVTGRNRLTVPWPRLGRRGVGGGQTLGEARLSFDQYFEVCR